MVKVKIVGFKQFQDLMKQAPEKLRKEIGTEVRLAAENHRTLAVKDAPKDMGGLAQSITTKQINPLSWEVTVQKHYAAYVEFGTKRKFKAIPGVDSSVYKGKSGRGDYYDFLNSILDWVKRKGIAGRFSVKSRKQLNSKADKDRLVDVAQAIANSIMRHGIKPRPFFFKQLPVVRRDFFRGVRAALKGFL